MKSIVLLLGACSMIVSAYRGPSPTQSPKDAVQELQHVLDKLNAIKAVRYDYYRDVNYRSEAYRNQISGSTYLDFAATQSVTGFKFQIESDAYKIVYDGSTLFSLDENQKTMKVSKQPRLRDFSSLSFFVNSIVTLRQSLKEILADQEIPKTLADTTIDNRSYYLLGFSLSSKRIDNLGTQSRLTDPRTILYKIIVNKIDNLPWQVIQTNSVTPQDYVLSRFSNYQIDSFTPVESSWHYFTYVKDYKPTIRE